MQYRVGGREKRRKGWNEREEGGKGKGEGEGKKDRDREPMKDCVSIVSICGCRSPQRPEQSYKLL